LPSRNNGIQPRPYANPEAAARKIIELAHAFEPAQDGRILIERLNGLILFQHEAMPAEYKAGLDRAIEGGWLELHESGTYVRLTGERPVRLSKPASKVPSLERNIPVAGIGNWTENCLHQS
jgi:hypothetical protein